MRPLPTPLGPTLVRIPASPPGSRLAGLIQTHTNLTNLNTINIISQK